MPPKSEIKKVEKKSVCQLTYKFLGFVEQPHPRTFYHNSNRIQYQPLYEEISQ
jgi:hypothetical protein